jgi:heavy metal sensor kinase
MKLQSIGVRLTLWYSLAFAVALVLLGGAMWLTVRQSLYHAIDEALRERVAGIIIFIQDHKDRLYLDEVKEEFRAHGDLFQVFDSGGGWVHQAETLAGTSVPSPEGKGPEPQFENLASPTGALRFVSQTVEIDGHGYVVQAAAPLRDLQQGLRDALWVLVPMFPLALLLASAAGYWVSRRALAPVAAITETARSITAENLKQRLDVPSTGDELARLSATLNDMIARLESSFGRVSQFTADASHELRTPLAVMRTTAEVALRARADDVERTAALEQIVAEVGRTSNLVENLLQLAKADSGNERLAMGRVDVVALGREAATEIDVLAKTKGIRLASELPNGAVHVHGDPRALRQLLLILLDNAVKYTPAGGRVELAIAATDGHASLSVRDTGIGISAEDVPHIFDRFYRVDRARSRAQGGAGLGLAIGQWIAEAHGGDILVESELECGSVFRVRLPVFP